MKDEVRFGHPTNRELFQTGSRLSAFVVSDQGIVVSACRYLDAMASDVALPHGLASRHLAGASISQVTDAVANRGLGKFYGKSFR